MVVLFLLSELSIGMVAVAMNEVCLSDWLPCSRRVKGVGIGMCVKNVRGKIVICCRFSDVSILELEIAKGARNERPEPRFEY